MSVGKYKAGDSVRRVSQPEDYSGRAVVGQDYVVERVDEYGNLHLHGIIGAFYPIHFEFSRDAKRREFLAPEPTPPASNGRALPTDSDTRKRFPLFSGCLAYFPAALAEVSNHSYLGNEKHNPGLPLQHARGKSGDHLDCVLRHIVDSREVEGRARIEELRAGAWRMLAELQEELERQGTKPAPAATFD